MPMHPTQGTRLFYTESGEGRPIVFLHGFPLDSRIWRAQVAGLSDKGRVIAVDLRSFGRSISPDHFTIESLADDVHHFLLALKALPCTLAGLSMGGYVALAYARKYPTDLNALILIDTRAEADDEAGKQARNEMIEMARTGGSHPIAEKMEPRMLAPETIQAKPNVVAELRQIMEACPRLTIQYALAAMRDRPDFTSTLGNIKCPALIVVGESDAITPLKFAATMQKGIPNAQLAVIEKAGHMTPMEEPDQINTVIGKFISGLS